MHILLSRATRSEARDETPMPAEASYDLISGVWRGNAGLLAYDPSTETNTKKMDIETGEDQKGQ